MWRGFFLALLLGTLSVCVLPGHVAKSPSCVSISGPAYGTLLPSNLATPPASRHAPTGSGTQNIVLPAIDPTVASALIGLLGTIIVTGVGLFQFFSNRRIEHDRKELETLKAQVSASINTSTAPPIKLLGPVAEILYLDKLRSDPELVDVQTAEMSYTLKQEDIYIPIKVLPNALLLYKLDPAWLAAQSRRDPEDIFRTYLQSLEGLYADAQPLDAIVTAPHLRCVLVGEIGGGQSTSLKALARKAVHGQLAFTYTGQVYQLDLPIYIDLGSFASLLAQKDCDLIDFAVTQWVQRYGYTYNEVQALFQARFAAGRAIFLLDELDAALQGPTAEKIYAQVIEAINNLSTRYEKASIVVASRKNGYERLKTRGLTLNGFNEWELPGFLPEHAMEYVTCWLADRNAQRASGLIPEQLSSYLACSMRLLTLAAHPLFLFLLVTFQNQQGPPVNTLKFYERCVSALLARWDAPRNHARVLSPREVCQVLSCVAWHFHRHERCYFPQDELLKILGVALAQTGRQEAAQLQPELVLQYIIDETGLLLQLTQGTLASYSFLCFPLQEYFAAYYAILYKEHAFLLEKAHSPWWEEVLVLYASAGQSSNVNPLLQKLSGEDTQALLDDMFASLLTLAGRCLAVVPSGEVLPLQYSILLRLCTSLAQSSSSFVQERIARSFADMDKASFDTDFRALLAQTHQEDPDMYLFAPAELLPVLANTCLDLELRKRLYNIGSLKNQELAVAVKLLFVDEAVVLAQRLCLARFLPILCARPMVLALFALVADTQVSADIRCTIIHALGVRGDRSFTARLVEQLECGDTPEQLQICRSIISTLGFLGDRAALSGLELFYKTARSDRSLRWNTVLAWGALGALQKPEDVRKLQLLFSSTGNSGDVYLDKYIWALSGIRGKQELAQEFLLLLADQHTDVDLRPHLIDALGYLGTDKATVSALLPYWQDDTLHASLYQTLWRLSRRTGVIIRKNVAGDALEIEES